MPEQPEEIVGPVEIVEKACVTNKKGRREAGLSASAGGLVRTYSSNRRARCSASAWCRSRFRSRGRALHRIQVGVEIFDLRRPVVHEGVFEAAAQHPAELRLGGAAEAQRVGLDVAERGAGGEVGQEAVEGVADAAARGAEPGVLGFAAQWAVDRGRPLTPLQSMSPRRPPPPSPIASYSPRCRRS